MNTYSIRNQESGDVLDVYHGTDGRVGTLSPSHGLYTVRVLIPGRVAWVCEKSTGSVDEAYAMIDAVRNTVVTCARQGCGRPSVGTVVHYSMDPQRACSEHGFAFPREYPVTGLTFVTDADATVEA